jgi:hypothetical protein
VIYALLVALVILVGIQAEVWRSELKYWMNRSDSGPTWAHWIDDTTWECGGCGALNGWDRYGCHFCQRQRKNERSGEGV